MGNMTQERTNFDGARTGGNASAASSGGSSLSGPVLALGVAAFVFFLSTQASNASLGWVNPLGSPTHSPSMASSTGGAAQPDYESTSNSLPPWAACGAIASLGVVAFVGARKVQRKQTAIPMRYAPSGPYNGQGIFPGGGDGSWREGKKGSFGKSGAESITPVIFPSGNMTQERTNFDGARTGGNASAASSGGSSLSGPVLALGVAAFVFFLSTQASNALTN